MGEGIDIGKIKKAIKGNKNLAIAESVEMGGYGCLESRWGTYDSSLRNFGETFSLSLPKDCEANLTGERLKKYIEETLSQVEKHDLTAVEFGGPGSQLFKGFTKNFFAKTVGVCLKDIRNQDWQEDDIKNNHSVIIGDILDVQNNQLFNKIAQILGTNKTDLIISRMDGPLEYIKKHPAILDRIIRNWYKLLNENGLMFIQFERPIDTFLVGGSIKTQVAEWSNTIKKRFPEIDIQISGIGDGILRLHKIVGAPEKLPSVAELF